MSGSTRYGFEWDGTAVERSMAIPGRGRLVTIGPTEREKAKRQSWSMIEVYVSERGRSMRVYRRWINKGPDGEQWVTGLIELTPKGV